MNIRVLEGRLTEVPTPDASGIDRRAFGEFVGPQGELASYAFGWVTGSDPHAALLTVGIGAGNLGGATIHARIVDNGDGHAFALVDERFENVPQGGPHLTARQARAHEDLPFMWWVADCVLARDRRAWWMRHWLMGTHGIQTRQVFERTEPVLLVSHDEDHVWQLIGSSDAASDGKIGHLSHAVDEDPTLVDVLDLEPGERATRSAQGGPWTRHPAPGQRSRWTGRRPRGGS